MFLKLSFSLFFHKKIFLLKLKITIYRCAKFLKMVANYKLKHDQTEKPHQIILHEVHLLLN